MRMLLIGGLGYIGSTLAELIYDSDSHDYVTILDPLLFGVDPNYFHKIFNNDRFRFIKGDVSDMRLTWEMIKRHDVVVYMASLTLPATIRDPEEGIFVNRYMAEMTADCCTKMGKRMVFMSTCSNYGRSDKPIAEDGELLPVSMYARTKVDAENYLLKNMPDVTVLRCATAYGVGAGRTRWDVLFNNFVQKAVSTGIIDVFQPDACRPICHVADIARAIHMIALNPESCTNPVYNVGSDAQNYTKKEIAQIVSDHTGAEIQFTEQEDNRDYRVDFGRIKKDLGYAPLHTPKSELPNLINLCDKTEKPKLEGVK